MAPRRAQRLARAAPQDRDHAFATLFHPERDADLREVLAPLLPDAADLPPAPSGREALFRAATLCVERAARDGGPLLLVIDDAHWLDDASADLLHFAALGLRRAPRVHFLLGAREGELRDRAGVARAVRALRREGLVDDLRLPPLTAEETRALVSASAAGAGDRVYEQSAGNPLFALELSREWHPEKEEIPATLSRLVRDRVDALSPEEADVLGWASVLGSHFDTELLGRLVALGEDALVLALDRLVRHRWLEFEGNAAAGDSVRPSAFTHELVRRGVYEQLSEPRRRLMHGRVARALAAQNDPDGRIATAVADHALLGGDGAMAARACLSAGQRCLRSYAHADTFRLARHGLSYAETLPDPERTTLSIELLALSFEARRPDVPEQSVAQFGALASRALDLGAIDHARIAFFLRASVMWERGDVANARSHSREVERLSRLGTDAERVAALSDAARCLAVLEQNLPQAKRSPPTVLLPAGPQPPRRRRRSWDTHTAMNPR